MIFIVMLLDEGYQVHLEKF
jgi:hypothetical protein